MIQKVDHLGIVVRSIDESLKFWQETLGLPLRGRERVGSEGVDVAFLPAGETRVELLQSVDPGSAVAKFLDKRGPGMHHVTFAVGNVQEVLDRVAAAGFALLDPAPRAGAEGTRVAFLHPRATGGVLVELVERAVDEAPVAALRPGAAVLAYLKEPNEKLWGVLRALDGNGLLLEGIDLASFDDWVAQVERRDEGAVGPSILFLPMARVEKILLDRPSGDLPSLAQRFRARTGLTVQQVLGEPSSG